MATATVVSSVVKIGDRKKMQGKYHKYILNELGDYVCNYCEKTSKNQSTISEHISRLHSKEAGRIVKPFQCETCEKRFNSASIRDQHIQNNHRNVRDTLCVAPGCSYEGKADAARCSHYVRKHMNMSLLCREVDGKNSMCNNCGKNMINSSMIYHLAKCSPLSPYCKVKTLKPILTMISVAAQILEHCPTVSSKPERKTVINSFSEFKRTPILNNRRVIVDLSDAKPADIICSPSSIDKAEKKKIFRKKRCARKQIVIELASEINDDDDELVFASIKK